MLPPERHLHLVPPLPERSCAKPDASGLEGMIAALRGHQLGDQRYNQTRAEPQKPWNYYANGDPDYSNKALRNDEEACHYFGILANAIDPDNMRRYVPEVTLTPISILDAVVPKGGIDVRGLTQVVNHAPQTAVHLKAYDNSARFTRHALFLYAHNSGPLRITKTKKWAAPEQGVKPDWLEVTGSQATVVPTVGELALAYLLTDRVQAISRGYVTTPPGMDIPTDTQRLALLKRMKLIDSSSPLP